jgi:lipid II:glycine glycyltransferase (peptidoglycan interpeptide bridge formation enzyme)
LTIHIAFKSDRAVAAILTLSHKDTITYKYGCSDEQFNQLGATPFLFWRTIQEAKDNGMRQFDLGRSDLDNDGLIAFKGRLGAARSTMTYWRYPSSEPNRRPGPGNLAKIGKYIFSKVPDAVLIESGRLLYRHMG